jgi:hypothetical protein
MDYQLSVKLRNSIAARAHLYGAEAVILEKEADQLASASGQAPESIAVATADQIRALSLAQQAQQARRRYFRELEAVDLLGGHSNAFTRLVT